MSIKEKKQNGQAAAEKIQSFIQRICTPRTVAVGLTAAYFISLVPLLILARYNHASADDYTNGEMCYHVWTDSHSAWKLLCTAVSRAAMEWRTWRGCYTSAFFSALPPQIFGENFYGITTWMILIMITVSVFCLFHKIMVKILDMDKWTSMSAAALALFLMVQCTPGGVELFYWYSGAVNYTFMFGVSLLFYSVMLSLLNGGGRWYRGRIAAASVLGFMVGGANQMTALNAAVLMAVLALYVIGRKEKGRTMGLLIPIFVFYAGFVLGIAAPGNYVRAASTSGMNPVKAVLISFYYCLDLVFNEWLTWPVAVVLVMTAALVWRGVGRTAFRFPAPFLVVLFGYCLVSAMMTPPLFAVGNIDSGRAQGTVYGMFILTAVLCTVYVAGWARKRYDGASAERTGGGYCGNDAAESKTGGRSGYGAAESLCITGCLLFLAFGIMLTLIPSPRRFVFGSAAVDCINGSAEAYGEALDARAVLYKEGAGAQIEVPPLEQKPELLFFSDITENADDWTNRGVARFYGLDGVVLQNEGSTALTP